MDISVENYLCNATKHAESTLLGNYKVGNKSAIELERMNNFILKLKNDDVVYNIIDSIIQSNCANAIMWITPVCREKQYKLEVIRTKLVDYSRDDRLGILSFNAAMLLKTVV